MLFEQVAVLKLLNEARGAKAVRERGIRALRNICLDFVPVSLVVAYLLAMRADGKKAVQGLHLRQGRLQFTDELFLFEVALPALDGISDRPRQYEASQFVLWQVVLRPGIDGSRSHRLVGEARQYDDGHVGSHSAHPLESLEAVTFGQLEVEQNCIELAFGQRFSRSFQIQSARQDDGRLLRLSQQAAYEESVVLAVLDEENLQLGRM